MAGIVTPLLRGRETGELRGQGDRQDSLPGEDPPRQVSPPEHEGTAQHPAR